MTAYELRRLYRKHQPEGHYFDPDTLKWFGESMSTMRVLRGTVKVTDYSGAEHECYTLSKLSRKYPGGSRRTYAYFDTTTFDDILPDSKEEQA